MSSRRQYPNFISDEFHISLDATFEKCIFGSQEVVRMMKSGKSNGLVNSITDIEEQSLPSVRLTVPVRPDQEEVLTRIVRTISTNRSKNNRQQRITKASIIRAYIDAMSSITLDYDEIPDEKEIVRRLVSALSVQD